MDAHHSKALTDPDWKVLPWKFFGVLVVHGMLIGFLGRQSEVLGIVASVISSLLLPATLMVDCSHANSSKQHEKQLDVARDVAAQIAGGSRGVFGLMVESHIQSGAQKFTPGKDDVAALEYGKSITDACIGWDGTQTVLQLLSDAVLARRAR